MASMTGYATKEFKIENTGFVIFIKSLNSQKGLDLSIKTPRYLIEIEADIKKIIEEKLIRGKIDFKITESSIYQDVGGVDKTQIIKNISLLERISPKSDRKDILHTAVVMCSLSKPQVFQMQSKFKQVFLEKIESTVLSVVKYREKEGRQLYKAIRSYISSIRACNKQLIPLEKSRKIRKKEKLLAQLKSIEDQNIDYSQLKLEEAMIYYFEKHDITEERVRLDCHCKFFLEILKNEQLVGRKLNFLSQEILREINTIGSKANDFDLQKCVVQMKENIDKIKEQIQNIL